MGSLEEYECKQCGQVFEAEIGGGILSMLFRCPSCGATHSIRKGKTEPDHSIDFRSFICETPAPPTCSQCDTQMKSNISPMCPQCHSSLIRYRKTILSYD